MLQLLLQMLPIEAHLIRFTTNATAVVHATSAVAALCRAYVHSGIHPSDTTSDAQLCF
jgi:hypothetical protein